jgi:hypothetical protein
MWRTTLLSVRQPTLSGDQVGTHASDISARHLEAELDCPDPWSHGRASDRCLQRVLRAVDAEHAKPSTRHDGLDGLRRHSACRLHSRPRAWLSCSRPVVPTRQSRRCVPALIRRLWASLLACVPSAVRETGHHEDASTNGRRHRGAHLTANIGERAGPPVLITFHDHWSLKAAHRRRSPAEPFQEQSAHVLRPARAHIPAFTDVSRLGPACS